MSSDIRALIHRMADELDHLKQLLRDSRERHPLAAEARAALAEPEPGEGPSDAMQRLLAAPMDSWGYVDLRRPAAPPAPEAGEEPDGPAVPEGREPASVAAEASPSPADRMALAMCKFNRQCEVVCPWCRQASAKVAHEIARQLRERYGDSATADWLDGVGCHPWH